MKGECTILEYYQNYHKHTSLSHRYNKDSSLVPMDYFKTMKPLADKGIPQIYSTVEHGWQGNYFKEYLDLQKFNEDNAKDNPNYKPIKFVFGTEAYWVKDHKAKDKSNNHIILLAKNDNGRKALNEAICKSFITEESIQNGTARNMFPDMNLQDDDIYYYYKNRMDLDLLETLPKDDIFVTTACVAYWLGYSNLDNWADIDECVLRMNNHFTDFYLEVQANNTEKQKKINRHIMELHYKYDIPIIAATDSHEITMSQMQDREYLLESNNISYPEEDGNYMDFPNIDVLRQRFKEQGILTEAEWNEAINNTNVILNFEDIDLISKTWQIPIAKQFKGLSQEERNQKLKDLIIKQWREQFNDINKDKLQQYYKEIQHDYNEIVKCDMADYFLDDYLILKTGQEKYHGVLTSTGRGSAVGMYINKLLGFTKVDKVNSPVQMYSERFMTADRINSGTAPDVDNNVATREPFIQAERDIVGYNGVFDIMALGLLKYKSAFKMFARANNLNPQLQNIVTSQIDIYENAVKHKEDDETEDDYDIHNYVDSKYWDLIDGCQKYRGIVDHLGASPCATILYDGNVIRDVGVIMIKSETTKKETWIALQESPTMDTCKFLKNDILIVDSIGLAKDIYDEIGMKPFTINELLNEIENDKKVWDIYKNGYTMCINQVEQDKSRAKVMRYKPTNISELCQFVAAIRPGFQSMYNKFEKREHFEYGIKSLDNIIQDQYRNSSFIIYQEDLMKILGFAGFSMTETYPIIKAISKKKKYVIESAKDRFIPNFTKAIMNSGDADSENKAKEIAKKVWQIIEDNASYSFNCSHSYCMALDSVTLAWQKAYHPYEFYKVCLERYTNKGDKNKVAKIKQEMNQMGIKLSPLKFHEDNRHFLVSPTHEYITQRLDSIKSIQKTAPQFLYELGQHQYLSFMDLLKVLEENKKLCNNTSIVKLIKLNYFSEFGSVNKLLLEKNLYDEFASKKIFKKDKYQNNKLYYQGLQLYATEQKTRFTNLDFKQFAKFIIERTYINDVTVMDMAQSEIQYTGYSIKTIKDCKYGIVANVKTDKYNSNKHTVSLYSLSTGQIKDFATDKKWFAETELNEGDIINPIFNKIPLRVVNEKGERVASKTQFYWELSMWSIVKKGD